MEELKSDLSNIFIDALVKNLSQLIQKDAVQDIASNNGTDPCTVIGRQDEMFDKDVPLYDIISQALKYHRDSYLVGSTYASIQRFRRTKQYNNVGPTFNAATEHFTWNHMPLASGKKEESIANVHLQGLVTWFIPSKTMLELVRPTVMWTVSPPLIRLTVWSHGGPLYSPLVQAISNLIPLSQPMLDQILKESMLQLLKSPEWRHWVKGTTGGYVSSLQRDVNEDR